MPTLRRLLPLCATALVLALPLGSLAAADDGEVRVAVAEIGKATLIVSAPGGGSPDPVTAAKLRQKVTLRFEDQPFEEVVDFLHRQTGLNLVIDPAAQPGPVTLRVDDMTLGTALGWIANQGGVQVNFLHEAVYLSDRAVRGARETRIYDVADLSKPVPNFQGPELAYSGGSEGGGVGWELFPDQGGGDEVQRPSVDELAELIEDHLNRRR